MCHGEAGRGIGRCRGLGVPGFESQFCSPFQLLIRSKRGGSSDGSGTWVSATVWEPWEEFLAPGLGLAKPPTIVGI